MTGARDSGEGSGFGGGGFKVGTKAEKDGHVAGRASMRRAHGGAPVDIAFTTSRCDSKCTRPATDIRMNIQPTHCGSR